MATLATPGTRFPIGRALAALARLTSPGAAPRPSRARLSDEAWLRDRAAEAHLEGHGRDYRATSYGGGPSWHR